MATRNDQSTSKPVQLAVTEGGTTPNPGTTNAVAFSTITNTLMRWTGSAWTAVSAGLPTGGTTGQALLKTSSTNYATGWALPPGSLVARFRQTTLQTYADATPAALIWQTVDYDRYGLVSTGSPFSVYTPGVAGWYELSGGYAFVVNATGRRDAYWAISGSAVSGSLVIGAPVNTSVFAAFPARTTVVQLSASDTVALLAQQNSGANLNTYVTTTGQSSMNIVWLGA